MRTLIEKAFHAKEFQISSWLSSERYDIVAKTSNADISDDELWLLLRPVLAERFKLRYHRQTKDLPVYALVVAKGGMKLKAASAGETPSQRGSSGDGKASIDARRTGIAKLADMLGNHMDRTVVDRARLRGEYDFHLDWAQEHPGEQSTPSVPGQIEEGLGFSSGPTIFTALQEQLGLKLESARGPVEIIVIDGAERASAN